MVSGASTLPKTNSMQHIAWDMHHVAKKVFQEAWLSLGSVVEGPMLAKKL